MYIAPLGGLGKILLTLLSGRVMILDLCNFIIISINKSSETFYITIAVKKNTSILILIPLINKLLCTVPFYFPFYDHAEFDTVKY